MHLSASQIGMYRRCPESYRRRYMEGEKFPPGVALIRGSSVHRGAGHNFTQKIQTHEDLEADEVVDYTASAFDERLAEDGILLSPDEASRGKDTVVGEEKDRVVRLARLLMTDLSPQIQPSMVEAEVTVNFKEFDMVGVLDLITDDERVPDLKTATKSKAKNSQHGDFQLTTYAGLYFALRKVMPAELSLEVLVDKKKPELQRMPTIRTIDDLEPWMRTVQAVYRAVQHGDFPPTDKSNWQCSPKWCGYWGTCPYWSDSERKRVFV